MWTSPSRTNNVESLSSNLTSFQLNIVIKRPRSKRWRYESGLGFRIRVCDKRHLFFSSQSFILFSLFWVVSWFLCSSVTCVLVLLLVALYFLWMVSHHYHFYIQGFLCFYSLVLCLEKRRVPPQIDTYSYITLCNMIHFY